MPQSSKPIPQPKTKNTTSCMFLGFSVLVLSSASVVGWGSRILGGFFRAPCLGACAPPSGLPSLLCCALEFGAGSPWSLIKNDSDSGFLFIKYRVYIGTC